EVRHDVLARLRGINLFVNLEDLAVPTDVEGPSVGQLPRVIAAVVGHHAIFLCGFLRGIGEKRKVGSFLFGEGRVVLEGISADHEVRDVERSNQLTTLTEGPAFGSSTSGERFWKPG